MDKHRNRAVWTLPASLNGHHKLQQVGRRAFSALLALCSLTGAAEAGTLSLAWNANPEPGVAGYVLYYGTIPGAYTGSINVGNRTQYNFTEPQAGGVYFFALQAYNLTGLGGPLSNEISSTTNTYANFDGDARSDFVTFRPSDGRWSVFKTGTGTVLSISWGLSSDIPVTGDYDGDGKSDIVVFRPSQGIWFILQSTENYDSAKALAIPWGASGDTPFIGDIDGDGRGDLTLFRPSTGQWFVRFANAATWAITWGASGDIPLLGDFDGDFKPDFTVYRPSSGHWFVTSSRYGYSAFASWARKWGGVADDKPLIGDYDGDSKADLAIYRTAEGRFYVWLSSLNFYPGHAFWFNWGTTGDRPLSADFDGDRRSDMVVFRPSDGRWYVRFSSSNFTSTAAYVWSTGGDIPISR